LHCLIPTESHKDKVGRRNFKLNNLKVTFCEKSYFFLLEINLSNSNIHAYARTRVSSNKYIHRKAYLLHFGFDYIRTSQLLQRVVKNKATGTSLIGVLNAVIGLWYHVYQCRCWLYIHRRGAFSVARFDNPGNAKAFIEWNE